MKDFRAKFENGWNFSLFYLFLGPKTQKTNSQRAVELNTDRKNKKNKKNHWEENYPPWAARRWAYCQSRCCAIVEEVLWKFWKIGGLIHHLTYFYRSKKS